MKDWKIVFKSHDVHPAVIIKGLLEDQGLQAVLLSKKDSSLFFPTGMHEVYVPEQQEEQANLIIKDGEENQ
ncbi:MAG: DUF2007 domain-containing protein [Cyclobacteriaceae bacterium]|nr:DUF2007 domain-containing protein [Cyclobacteriaceae bacterium]MCH8515635.1 DUF2007 domain-containing protein [Cyclobacteriaceae bacterium]